MKRIAIICVVALAAVVLQGCENVRVSLVRTGMTMRITRPETQAPSAAGAAAIPPAAFVLTEVFFKSAVSNLKDIAIAAANAGLNVEGTASSGILEVSVEENPKEK